MTDPFRTPRLLKGKGGWWYLGGRRLALLSPAAVDGTGRLRPDVERHLDASGVNDPGPRPAYSLTVLTATACNLGCAYCFQNTGPDPSGSSRPPRIATWSLSRETARRILRFTSGKMAEAGVDKLDLHLFGGEPLLNPDGCRYLLELASGRGPVSARLTSNGTLLTPGLARELAGLGLGLMQITFDGNRAVHDRTRVRRSGGATFDQILTNIARATEVTDLRWSLRVNVTQHNRDGLMEMVEQIADRVDPTRCRIRFSLVIDTGVGFTGTAARDANLVDSMVGWRIRAAELGFGIELPTPTMPCLSCSFRDGKLGAVVNADGTLYSCWESAGKPGWEVGTVDTGYLPADQVDGRWVPCGFDGRDIDAAAAREFDDAVDARVLDYLQAIGRLDRRSYADMAP